MWKIWSAKEKEPVGAQEKYIKINSLLVDLFEFHLRSLESGRQLHSEEKKLAVREIGERIDRIMQI